MIKLKPKYLTKGRVKRYELLKRTHRYVWVLTDVPLKRRQMIKRNILDMYGKAITD